MRKQGSEAVEKANAPRKRGLLGPLWLIGLLVSLGIFLALNFVLYRSSTMGGLGLRYFILPVIVSLLLFVAGVSFVWYLYRLEGLGHGFSYLLASAVGIGYASLGVSEGKAQIEKPGMINPIIRIGGPGYLIVHPGSVVLLEDYAGSIRVLGAGQHFIGPTETIKEMLTLEEQKALVEKMSATTRDGIEVVARDVQYRYRLDRGLAPKSSAGYMADNPFP